MKIHELGPILWTNNIEETRTFYEHILGFTGEGNFPGFVSLQKDDVRIMFVIPDREDVDCNALIPSLTGSLYFFVDDADAFWNEVKDKAKVRSAIEDRAYRMRDFAIMDNNGYELVFGHDISGQKI